MTNYEPWIMLRDIELQNNEMQDGDSQGATTDPDEAPCEERLNQYGDYYIQKQYPWREKLQGKLLDYLMNLARKNISGQDPSNIAKFDEEVSSSFFEFVRTHPENAKFPSDEVYFYIIACYSEEIEDVFGSIFLEIENEEYRLNDRLMAVYEKEKLAFYETNPELLQHKQEEELVAYRASKLHDELQVRMRQKTKLPDFDLSDLM